MITKIKYIPLSYRPNDKLDELILKSSLIIETGGIQNKFFFIFSELGNGIQNTKITLNYGIK